MIKTYCQCRFTPLDRPHPLDCMRPSLRKINSMSLQVNHEEDPFSTITATALLASKI